MSTKKNYKMYVKYQDPKYKGPTVDKMFVYDMFEASILLENYVDKDVLQVTIYNERLNKGDNKNEI